MKWIGLNTVRTSNWMYSDPELLDILARVELVYLGDKELWNKGNIKRFHEFDYSRFSISLVFLNIVISQVKSIVNCEQTYKEIIEKNVS